jgi:hypothetical protein
MADLTLRGWLVGPVHVPEPLGSSACYQIKLLPPGDFATSPGPIPRRPPSAGCGLSEALGSVGTWGLGVGSKRLSDNRRSRRKGALPKTTASFGGRASSRAQTFPLAGARVDARPTTFGFAPGPPHRVPNRLGNTPLRRLLEGTGPFKRAPGGQRMRGAGL